MPTLNQKISLSEAVTLTAAFRAANPPDAIRAEASYKEILQEILAQTGCVGIRIYKGLDADGKPSNVLVGMDADGNDILDGVLGNRSVKTLGVHNDLNP